MHDFVSHVLRKYWEATGWNGYNSYLHLTSTSAAVLDFPIPSGLSFSISASPSPPFFTTYRLRVLPSLSGALGYIFASTDPDAKGLDISKGSRETRLKDFVERFRILDVPRRPGQGRWPVYLGGKRVEGKDYLMFGCMHVPSARLDALYTTRLSPTWQLLVTAVSIPAKSSSFYSHRADRSSSELGPGGGGSSANGTGPAPPPPPPPPQPQSSGLGQTNLQLMLQQDTGRWFTEYSYSADDALWGLRVLHNFGTPGGAASGEGQGDAAASQGELAAAAAAGGSTSPDGGDKGRSRRVDEESALEAVVGGGLQGRFSAGAELFFSAAEKSAGISTGIRFTTLPEPAQAHSSEGGAQDGQATHMAPSQPPTTITATLNPMMGHLSTAYAAKMTRDIVACSRFDFNVYSYDSELTLGAEYWLRSSPTSSSQASPSSSSSAGPRPAASTSAKNVTAAPSSPEEPLIEALHVPREPVAKPAQGLSLRDGRIGQLSAPVVGGAELGGPTLNLRERAVAPVEEVEAQLSQATRPGEAKEALLDSTMQASDSNFASTTPSPLSVPHPTSSVPPGGIIGVIKARLSTSGDVALLWESRLRNCLVSFGVRADLSSRTLGGGSGRKRSAASPIGTGRPLKGIGLDVLYFSSTDEARERAGADVGPSFDRP